MPPTISIPNSDATPDQADTEAADEIPPWERVGTESGGQATKRHLPTKRLVPLFPRVFCANQRWAVVVTWIVCVCVCVCVCLLLVFTLG